MAKGDMLILKSDSGRYIALNPEHIVYMTPAYSLPDTHTGIVTTGKMNFVVEGTFNWVVEMWRGCRDKA